MTDIMRMGRALAEAVREKVRLERELSIVTARINTLSAEIMSAVEVTGLNSAQPETRHCSCQDQDCPNANWPHYASDDLVAFNTQDVPPMPRDFVSDFVSCPPECAEVNRHVHTPRGNVIRVLSSGDSL